MYQLLVVFPGPLSIEEVSKIGSVLLLSLLDGVHVTSMHVRTQMLIGTRLFMVMVYAQPQCL